MSESETLIVMPVSQFKRLLNETLDEREKSRVENDDDKKSVTISKASKIIGRHFSTIKKHVETGAIKTTLDGRITMKEIRRFLDGNNQKD